MAANWGAGRLLTPLAAFPQWREAKADSDRLGRVYGRISGEQRV